MPLPEPSVRISENVLINPMPGLVVEIRVKPVDRVYRGQELVVLESMKMGSVVSSPCDGTVFDVLIKRKQTVETGNILIRFSPDKLPVISKGGVGGKDDGV